MLEPKPPTKPPTAATPAAEVTPKKLAAAGPKKKPKATVVIILPTEDLAKSFTAFPILFAVLLSALPTALNGFVTDFQKPYSRKPVRGLIVPIPPDI